ncbi:MMPL family transporter [Patulibacter americanus]|uniref:MMPL family transporter n=1 Tax=Patulibacter americanus TaxID=588672 RepID=UPI0003B75FB2|nr:MMPL family transporter [Patulibacter americanus]
MSALLARIARALTHHWKRSLAAAIAIIVLLGVVAGQSSPAPDDFSAPGTETQQALDLLTAHSPALAGSEATVVFSAKDGKITDAKNREAVTAALAEIKPLVGAKGTVSDPFTEGGTVSPDGSIAAVDVRYTTEPADLEPEDGQKLEEAAKTAEEGGGVAVSMRGTVVDIAAEQEAPVGELVGVAIAIVLLTILFRSFAAMGATIFGALLGVMVGQLLLTALAKPLGLPEFASIIAVMLGLGAGIDYALLIIGRYREQVAAGDSVRDASAKAAATSGSSVVAAGLIVMVAIAGLLVIGIPLIGKMGIGAAIGVAAVVLSALTVLPIMIGAFKRWLTPKKASHVAASPAFGRWAERVTARPWVSIAAGVVVLLIFAAPVTQMRLGQPDDGNQPTSKTQRVAYDELSKGFGPGYNGPFLMAIDTGGKQKPTEAQLAKLQTAIASTPGMVKQSVSPAAPTPDGGAAIIFGTPTTAPQDARTSDTLEKLRKDVIPQATEGTPLAGKVYVGGNTAGFEDFSDKVASRLPLFIALVIGLSVLLLMAAFRSLWVPLVSAVFNLLSVGAAYGVVVAVFQEGVGASLLGVDSGVPIVSFIPVMIFAILFGLSMDYNVFLLSRVHEAYNEGEGPRQSVITGVSRIGKVILFAGLIMASVFLAFVSQPDVTAKMIGLGLGLAILIDVLVVRLVIAPAVVTLLGDKAWWLPGWLDRILPNVSLEGHLVKNKDPKGEPLPGMDKDVYAAPAD